MGSTGAEPWREILASEAQRGMLRAYWLECEGCPVAFQIGAIHENIYFMDFMGYLPRYASLGAGSILHSRVIQDLCNDGITGVDYGFGNADYKRRYGSESWDEATLMLYGRSGRARMAAGMMASTGALSRWIREGVRRLGLQERVKRAWRSRLRSQVPPRGAEERSDSQKPDTPGGGDQA